MFSIAATLSSVPLLLWASYFFLKSPIKVKFTYLRSLVNMPRGRDRSSQNFGATRIFLFCNGEKAIERIGIIHWSDSKYQDPSFAIPATQRIKSRSSQNPGWTRTQWSGWRTKVEARVLSRKGLSKVGDLSSSPFNEDGGRLRTVTYNLIQSVEEQKLLTQDCNLAPSSAH